jgi:DUF2934 family protein
MDINAGSPAFIIPSVADIAKGAYQIYLERGRVDGFDREDWLRAEHELKAPRKKGTSARS